MENRYSVSLLSKAVLTNAFLFIFSIVAFSQFYENFDGKNKAQLTADGWGYYPTSGISLISNSNAYSGRSLFTNAGGGNYEIVATPCLISNTPKDTLDFYFQYITVTGIFYVGVQKASQNVPGASLVWLDSFYVTPLWTPVMIPFIPPSYPYRIIFYMNTPGASFDKFGIDEFLVRHATSLGTCTLMPFEMTDFTAAPQTSGNNFNVDLKWETQSEMNTDYFQIMRSMDGVNFEAIANIDAAGNSTQLLHYEFIDKVNPSPVYFYQIKMADHGGTYSMSDVERVTFNMPTNWYYSAGTIYYVGEENAEVKVYSLLGSNIFTETVAAGSTLKMEPIVPGIYLVKVGEESFRKILVN